MPDESELPPHRSASLTEAPAGALGDHASRKLRSRRDAQLRKRTCQMLLDRFVGDRSRTSDNSRDRIDGFQDAWGT